MKNKKWLIAAGVFGMVLTGSAGVYAGTQLETIKAYLNHGLAIEVNGQKFTPTGDQGKKLAPITYQGSTYLPARSIAEALNTEVKYDAKNNKVSIGASSSSGGSASTGGGQSTSPSTGTNTQAPGVKSKYLPADFPLPKDAKATSLIENVVDGNKKVVLIYTSKESLSTLSSSYKNYYQNKNLTQNSEDIQADEFSILGREEGKYAVTITGNASSSDKDLNEVTVIWGEE
ncbi:copper amine oxidase N-terminal domain-containing protein [Paenibacillus polysaccharolyticus]|uniref:stalk domain-containing protein n=1 Tax=Paenibacillus polysaccharolyticus TaxID=582692 RepID=UPI0020A0AB58|nr:stalk domain-containing protein [Paenibacillus polysaccharolyticus]MCP1135654.1 copper amine oxidase N-terminal domain-containing protein [Paenibacillus polysaccharolyticus]